MKNLRITIPLLMFCILPLFTFGQADMPGELNSLVGIPLAKAQEKLQSMNYEIAASSLFKKNQLWYNESDNVCVQIFFDKKGDKLVESIKPGEEAECKKGVEAARKVWENYHDGQADASSEAIEQERTKLKKEGYIVSYWVNDVSPGKTMEVWINESKQLGKSISWDNASKSDVKVTDRDYKYARNPSPLKE